MSKSMIAAFFDVDGTLLKENTSMLYLRALHKDKKIGTGVLLKAIYYNLLHKINRLSYEDMAHFSLGFMKGWSIKELEQYGTLHFNRDILAKISKKMVSIIEKRKEEGQKIVLLTNSPNLIIKNFERLLQTDYSITSVIDVKDGKITGRFKTLCYKDNKYALFKEFSEEKRVDIDKSYFYTDSYSDIQILESIGHPIAVNPDRNLKKAAIDKGWKIISL